MIGGGSGRKKSGSTSFQRLRGFWKDARGLLV